MSTPSMKLTILSLNKPGITDFAGERNILLSKARTEWVLFVDTDEIVTPKLNEEIESAIRSKKYAGYYIKRKIIFMGNEIGEDKVLRLARRNSGKWTRAVHEVWNVRGRVGILKNYIIHNTAGDLAEYIERINKYSDIHARENLKEGKHATLWKIIVYPKLKFVQNVISGRGFVFSMLQSFHSFLSWSKLYFLHS